MSGVEILKHGVFTCSQCKRTFAKGWSNAESDAEAEEYFGVPGASKRNDFVVVCDDCFNHIHPKKHLDKVEQARLLLQKK